MMTRFFVIFLICLLNNCAAPGTALLTPAITGAKTKSAHHFLSLASSLSSKKILEDFNETKDTLFNKQREKKFILTKNPKFPDVPYVENDPKILLAYVVDDIEISDVYEPEPLP